MGVVNQATNLLDRIVRLERKVNEVWHKVGLASAVIRKGGLSLLEDAYLRMVDDQGVEILYAGPDSEGRQIIVLRREGGAPILFSYFTTTGEQYWALTDRTAHQVVADDAASGSGLARPYLPLPHAHTDWTVMPKTTSTSFDTIDELRYYKQHPRVAMTLRIGAQVGSTGEWRIMQGSTVRASGTIADGVLTAVPSLFAVDGSYLSPLSLDVQARVASGPGPVTAWIREAGGVQS